MSKPKKTKTFNNDINQNKDKKKDSNLRINNHENIWFDIFKILPLLFIVGILPFVIRLKLIPLEGPFYEFWNGEKINADFFTYYKQIFIYVIATWALLHTFFLTKKIKFTKAYYFMGGYAILVILSTVFSKYPQIALNGFVERKEGMWIILCYLLLMFATINLVETEKQIKAIIYTLGISGAIISTIAIFQYFGMDIFTTNFAKNYMISKELQLQIKEFNINFGEKYSYGVFYNPNYLGGYISLYAPLMLSFAIISKDIREKILFAIFFSFSIFALYGSKSEAGVLGTIVAIGLLLLVITARHIIKDKPKEEHQKLLLTRFVPMLLVIILIPFSLSYIPVDENPLSNIRKQLLSLSESFGVNNLNYKEIGPINDIKQINDNTIELIINNKTTLIQIENNSEINILGNNKEKLWGSDILKIENNVSTKIDNQKDYEAYVLVNKTEDNNVFGIKYNILTYNTTLTFIVDNQKISITDSKYKVLDLKKDFKVADHIGFEGKGELGSNRGYIWSRSLPILFNNIIIGTGQDTFTTEFPQHDIYARQVETVGWISGIMVDKPHCSYLQIGIHSGALSLLLALIGLFLLVIMSIKNAVFSDRLLILSIISLSIIGFLLSSLFNDSILAITPIFYVLLGLAARSTEKVIN